jgi:hypothetical protein
LVVVAFFLSMAMTLVSALAYGIGTRASVMARCAGAVVVLGYLLWTAVFISRHPAIAKDASKYWFGYVLAGVLIVIQGIYDRNHLGAMLGIRDVDF